MHQTNASKQQPEPKPGNKRVLDLVTQDLEERAEAGKKKYGTYLEIHNGRDAKWDAYQEVLDLAMYLRQLIAEDPMLVVSAIENTIDDRYSVRLVRQDKQWVAQIWDNIARGIVLSSNPYENMNSALLELEVNYERLGIRL